MLLVAITLLATAHGVYAKKSEWMVRKKGDGSFAFILFHPSDKRLSFEIGTEGGNPCFLEEEKCKGNPDILIVKYYGGTAGTHSFTRFTRALLVNMKYKKLIADILFEEEESSGSQPTKRAKVTCDYSQITITGTGTPHTIPLE
jgi:hypothetical protein